MLNISNPQGYANQNPIIYHLTLLGWALSKWKQEISVAENLEELEFLSTVGENVISSSHSGKQCRDSSKYIVKNMAIIW